MTSRFLILPFLICLVAAFLVACEQQNGAVRATRQTTAGTAVETSLPTATSEKAVQTALPPTTEIAVETALPPTAEIAVETSLPPATADAEPGPDSEPAAPEPPSTTAVSSHPVLQGIGLIGASTLDEYRGTDNRGGQYASVTYNMIEQLAILRGFNVGEWGEWGEPRRTGYEYNWARSSATSRTMIAQGQHTGIAGQVASGEVTFVMILVGANDFGPHIGRAYQNIYSGEMNDEALQRKIDRAIDDVTLAVDTVLEAGAQGVAVSLFPHWNYVPLLAARYPDAAGRQRVEDAITEINEGLWAMAEPRNVIIIDSDRFSEDLLLQLDDDGFFDFGGERIDFINPGNEPHHARLADQAGHGGTVISGIMANYYFIEPLNAAFGTNIPPLSAEEILTLAGLFAGQN